MRELTERLNTEADNKLRVRLGQEPLPVPYADLPLYPSPAEIAAFEAKNSPNTEGTTMPLNDDPTDAELASLQAFERGLTGVEIDDSESDPLFDRFARALNGPDATTDEETTR